MSTRQEVPVNPEILRWAREQSKLSLEQVVARAHITGLKSTGISGAERLSRWEERIEQPTFNELKSIAKAYRRPVLTFFLPIQPLTVPRLEDFRTFGDHSLVEFSPELAAFIRQIDALQQEVKDLLKEEGAEPLAFVGSIEPDTPPPSIAQTLREILNFPFEEQERINVRAPLFNILRNKAEEAGVFILRKADLGSHHTKISLDEFRGLTFADEIAPFIIVNPDDAESALLFSLIHELTHLCLGDSGISNDNILSPSDQQRKEREVLCNSVAAEFLVPTDKLIEELQYELSHDISDTIDFLARKFKVSRVVTGRRLLEIGHISTEVYWDLYNEWRMTWTDRRHRYSESDEGPGYYILTKSKLGSRLLRTIFNATFDGRLSYGDASNLLNVKVSNFNELQMV